ncbi:MAG: hypothetical protein U0414_13270 [Polyangiaceae bacterium]
MTILSKSGRVVPEEALELFELEMLGGATERRYRKLRPEVEALPWGTLEPSRFPAVDLAEARGHWTLAAFQEMRTCAATAEVIRALSGCRAPLDLIGLASAFPLDEVVHVEMCARVAEELGGGAPIKYDPYRLAPVPDHDEPPIVQAAEMITAVFCVGEAFSVPVLHGTWSAAKHPLLRGVLRIIVKDEAPHGAFGWTFLDWAGDRLDPYRERLAIVARLAIEEFTQNHRQIARLPTTDLGGDLGWMEPEPYLALSRRAMRDLVVAPLRARGIDPYAAAITDRIGDAARAP